MSFLTARDSSDPLILLEVASGERIEPKRDEYNAKFVNSSCNVLFAIGSRCWMFVWEMSLNTRQW